MKHYDPLRCTGRTTKMLERAIIDFFNGLDVIVTAYSFTYSLDLMNIVLAIVKDNQYITSSKRGVIHRGDNMMVFTKHFDNKYTPRDCVYIDPSRTYYLHEDHFHVDI